MTKPQAIGIVWTDHDCDLDSGPWISHEEAKEFAEKPATTCCTLGWLLHETDETLTVAATWTEDFIGPACDRILKRNIVRRWAIPVDSLTGGA